MAPSPEDNPDNMTQGNQVSSSVDNAASREQPVYGLGHGAENPTPLSSRSTPRHVAAPEQQAAFSRPKGWVSSFFKRSDTSSARRRTEPPVDPVLAEAFSPSSPGQSGLEPDPIFTAVRNATVPSRSQENDDDSLWAREDSIATVAYPKEPQPIKKIPVARKLGVREVLFGRAVSWKALGVLAVIALLIGAVGGYVGRISAVLQQQLTSSTPSIHQDHSDNPGNEPIEKVVAAGSPSIVALQGTSTSGQDTSMSIGSGIVISGQGYILTNNHVIDPISGDANPDLIAIFADNTKVPAHIVGRDPKTDVAVVKVNANNLTVATLGDSDKVHVGESVVAIGAPFNLKQTVTSGIISSVHRAFTIAESAKQLSVLDAIQTDASINEGNSGGGLFDLNGKVVGMNTAIRTSDKGGGSIGIGFAIPINQAHDTAVQLIENKQVHHPSLGVEARTVANKTGSGARIENVVEGSPADKAGLKEGDVVVKIGDRTIDSADQLQVAMLTMPIGSPVTIKVLRNFKPMQFTAIPSSD